LAYTVFAALTPHRQPSPKNGLRHFSALPTHHPTGGGDAIAQYGSTEIQQLILIKYGKRK
jgi:hypothetical protein